ncbi:TIGR01777 family oxidoreductase [Sporichthya sp.]|uniref:TIGR01777 family oxidoreductase n=1 Tax=Sporichthya sp. TaxID=65475 RepID=UPI0018569E3C|nr:TIGR01777 family oxidoreductase [Sporichthya sp.]MBA3743795.1 TIGR01777 family protein [Sporichthya sp.]
MKIALAGASGLIGTALVGALRADGHEVLQLVRRAPKHDGEVQWDPNQPLDPALLIGVQAAVCLSGAGVGDKRWSEDYKRTLLDSRVKPTHTLATALAALDLKPSVFLAGSAIGYYGETGDAPIDETAGPGNDFLAKLTVDWEAAAAPAEAAGIRVAYLRTGLVVARQGGAWGRMFPIFKLGLGGKLGNGRQYWSFISISDHVRAMQFLLTADVSGPVNMTGPEPVTNAEVTKAMGKVLHRPTLLPAPKFGLKIVLGEFSTEPLRSQRVLPNVLQKAGFAFEHPTIESAIRAAL